VSSAQKVVVTFSSDMRVCIRPRQSQIGSERFPVGEIGLLGGRHGTRL